MTTSYLPQDASGKKVSTTLSAKKSLDDIRGWDVERYIEQNHLPFYPRRRNAWQFAQEIGKNYNPSNGYAWPGQKELAESWGISTRQVGRYVSMLRDAVDADGNPLWKIVTGYSIGDSTARNRYYPLFLEDVLASLNGTDGVVDESGSSALTASDDNEMDTHSLEDDGNTPGFADIFDGVEEEFNLTPADAFDSEPAEAKPVEVLAASEGELEQEDGRPINLGSGVERSADLMMGKVEGRRVRRSKLDESKRPPLKHTTPPIIGTKGFAMLSKVDKEFLTYLIEYISYLINADQDKFNEVADKLVRQWVDSKKSNNRFYLEYMEQYLVDYPPGLP